ncbi:MAG: glutamyl-tRNA reductase [Candidatus Bathyarchaeia archaeon]
MRSTIKKAHIINVRLTHKTARVPLLESVAIKDKRNALTTIYTLHNVEECLLLQTCNRIELYVVSENVENTIKQIREYLMQKAGNMATEAAEAMEISLNSDACRHILRVACGLESMVIGEDQVLNQVWDSYLEAESAKTAGPILKHLFMRAINVGKRARCETEISKGAVSVGSAAVELAQTLLGKLEDKKVLVMGAGEIGTLVAKALARRCRNPIFIANRTYDRAVKLATELSGMAVKFDRLEDVLVEADVVFCSTSAPHYLLTRELVAKIIKQRQNRNDLLIVDISNPRNVENSVQEVEHVRLYNIDDLQLITEKNKQRRQKSIEEVTRIIEEELVSLEKELKVYSVREIISSMLSRAEEIRRRELATALGMLGNVDEKDKKIIDDLTFILIKQTFVPVIENLRLAAVNGDEQLIKAAATLFGTDKN